MVAARIGTAGSGMGGRAVSVAGEHLAAAAVQRRLSAAFDAAALDSVRPVAVDRPTSGMSPRAGFSPLPLRHAGRDWQSSTWGQTFRSGIG